MVQKNSSRRVISVLNDIAGLGWPLLAVWLVFVAFDVTLFLGGAYVVWHFVCKFW